MACLQPLMLQTNAGWSFLEV